MEHTYKPQDFSDPTEFLMVAILKASLSPEGDGLLDLDLVLTDYKRRLASIRLGVASHLQSLEAQKLIEIRSYKDNGRRKTLVMFAPYEAPLDLAERLEREGPTKRAVRAAEPRSGETGTVGRLSTEDRLQRLFNRFGGVVTKSDVCRSQIREAEPVLRQWLAEGRITVSQRVPERGAPATVYELAKEAPPPATVRRPSQEASA